MESSQAQGFYYQILSGLTTNELSDREFWFLCATRLHNSSKRYGLCAVSLKVCYQDASSKYPQHMFTWGDKANIYLDTPLICLCWGFTAQSTPWGLAERGQFTWPHFYWAGLVLQAVNQYCAQSFARNWQLPFLNQRKGENSRRKYFRVNLHERMLRPGEGRTRNPLITSRTRTQLIHWGRRTPLKSGAMKCRHFWSISLCCCYIHFRFLSFVFLFVLLFFFASISKGTNYVSSKRYWA